MQKAIKKNSIVFLGLIIFLITLLGLIAGLALFFLRSSSLVLYRTILNIIFILSIFFCGYILINGILVVFLLKGKKISFLPQKWLRTSLNVLYSNIMHISNLLKLDADKIRNIFAELNNRIVLSERRNIASKDILILLPHCLQNITCPHKITGDINNCKRCGLCVIGNLIELKERYNTNIFVATGGTLARRVIRRERPKAIIAVACERDLSSGILDVKNIPVIGILNERPEGPCVNTNVNLKDIENAIKFFIQEGE